MAYTVEELLKEYRQNKSAKNPKKIIFKGIEEGAKDVYNITAPFKIDGKEVIAGRVEPRDSELSVVYFFENKGEWWERLKDAPVFRLQDPFVTFISGELIFGGVEVFSHPENPKHLQWQTAFYRGRSLEGLTKFFTGPIGMKDLRLAELDDHKIAVLTRPQGEKGGRGKIGFYIADSLEAINIQDIEAAPLLDLFIDSEWGGSNEVHLLDDQTLGILGHIAKFSENGDRHYYSVSFKLNPKTIEVSDFKMIAERCDFLDGPAKDDGLKDVIFSGGLIRCGGKKAVLYVGTGDVEAQYVEIEDPLL